MSLTDAFSGLVYASVISATTFFSISTIFCNLEPTERSTCQPSNAHSSKDPNYSENDYSSDDLAYGLKDDALGAKAVEDWTIPANRGSPADADMNCLYPSFTENYVIWSSRTLDECLGVNIGKTTKTDRKTPSTAATATAAKSPAGFASATPAFLELVPQKNISPFSTSPEFQKIRKFSAAGHAVRPRSLGVAFSAAASYRSPVNVAKRIGKPRDPQSYTSNRVMHP